MESPLEISLSLIDEDPNQPRVTFNQSSLNELAETIRDRGVKTPISVRLHPKSKGRYLINHGARRFRASLLAGKESIPACIDNDYTEEDQLIENLHRENLAPMEIAEFIAKLLVKSGHSRGEIARLIGKSSAYVTQHLALLDLPQPVARAFASGQCNDVTVINELVTLLKRHPQHTTAWIEDTTQDITRSSVKLLREFLLSPAAGASEGTVAAPPEMPKRKTSPKTTSLKKAVLHVEWNERLACLLMKRRPTAEGMAWIKSFETGEEVEVLLEDIKLKALVEE